MSDDKKPSAKDDKLALEIGQRLVQARTGFGWSQQLLHGFSKVHDPDGIGISRAVLSLYETGVNKPGAREIKILCSVLKISPNWLLFGSESPTAALQPSLIFLKGDEISVSTRLALGILALDPTERDALASLLLSLLTKKLGDSKLSSLMTMSGYMADDLHKKIITEVGAENVKLPISELIEKFIDDAAEAFYTNTGTFRPLISEEDLETFNPVQPPSPRVLDTKKQ